MLKDFFNVKQRPFTLNIILILLILKCSLYKLLMVVIEDTCFDSWHPNFPLSGVKYFLIVFFGN